MLKKICLVIIATSGISYIIICLLLLWGQKKLIFVPDSQIKATPQQYGLNYQDVWIKIRQEQIHGWWIESDHKSAPVILYFHGNASNNGDIVDNAAIFHQLGLSVLVIDYRGYGKSSLTFPSETRVYEDAFASWHYLTQIRKINPQNIFVYGHSLGGAIAIELAKQQPEMAGLITEGTFTSMKEMGQLNPLFKLLPLDLIVTQRFDSINKISTLKIPLLMFHGINDEIVPHHMAQKLFERAAQPKKLVIVPQVGHNDLPRATNPKDYLDQLQQFIFTNNKRIKND